MGAVYVRDDTKDTKGRDAGRIARLTDDTFAHLDGPEWGAESAFAARFGVKIQLIPVTAAELNNLASSREDVKALNRAASRAR